MKRGFTGCFVSVPLAEGDSWCICCCEILVFVGPGSSVMPKAWSGKDERQYEHIKESEDKTGRSSKRAKQIAAATVNKRRSQEGRTKSGRKGSSSRASSRKGSRSR
jgi:hypothetical protein